MSSYKVILLLIFLLNFSPSQSSESECEKDSPNDKHDCFDRTTDDDSTMNYKCCYRKNERTGGTIDYECVLLDDSYYNYLDGYYKEKMLEEDDLTKINVECSQSFTNFSFILLFVLLINNLF